VVFGQLIVTASPLLLQISSYLAHAFQPILISRGEMWGGIILGDPEDDDAATIRGCGLSILRADRSAGQSRYLVYGPYSAVIVFRQRPGSWTSLPGYFQRLPVNTPLSEYYIRKSLSYVSLQKEFTGR
jgi:hypothetical protein